MNLDELQSIQSRERQASQLQHLRASFYEEVGQYIGELRAERNEVAAKSDNPFDDPDVEQISDEIRTAERTVESIYERRVGKVVKLASIAAADMPHDDDGLTTEEERLFETLVDAIEGNRETVLSVLDGESAALDCTPATGEGEATTDTTGAQPGSDSPAGHGDASAGQRTPGSADPVGESGSSGPVGATEASGTPGDGGGTDVGPDAGVPPETGSDPGADRPTPPDRPPNAAGEVADETGPPVGEDSLDIAGAMGGASDGSGTRNEPAAESGPGSDPAPGTGGERPTTADPGDRDDRAVAGAPEAPGDSPSPSEDEPIDRTTVRVTVDVGDIYGVDGRSYDLSAEDVVTLPTQNAEGLVSKDAAERLD